MPRWDRNRVPKLCFHGGARVYYSTFQGREVYFGRDKAAAEAEWRRVTAEWQANGGRLLPGTPVGGGGRPNTLTIDELTDAYDDHAAAYYVKNGRPTSELYLMRMVIKAVLKVYSGTSAADFTPSRLETIRDQFVRAGTCREKCNHHVHRIRRIFNWGVSKDMVAPEVYQKLLALGPLLAGKTDAPDRPKVKPVPAAHIDAVKPQVAAPVRAMIEIQVLTGMRPGDVCIMRGGDIDRNGPVVKRKRLWIYRPRSHKTEHVEGKEYWFFLEPTLPPVPAMLADEIRRQQILDELRCSRAETLILLGDEPIRWFLRFFDKRWSRLSDFCDAAYGRPHPVEIDGMTMSLLPLAHPRQVAALGMSSRKWFDIHSAWMKRSSRSPL